LFSPESSPYPLLPDGVLSTLLPYFLDIFTESSLRVFLSHIYLF
jgi:hypothetical protein